MASAHSRPNPVHYRTARIEGVELFFREAGPPTAPVVLLLRAVRQP